MDALPLSATVGLPSVRDAELSLLLRLEQLLAREAEALAARDANDLAAIADERDLVTARLAAAARARCAAPRRSSGADDEALLALYRRLRDQTDVQAQVVARHAARNARAIGVLAQASGRANLYQADGRVPMQYGPG